MNAYIYQAALHCKECITPVVIEKGLLAPFDHGDSDQQPAGPYSDGGGESDTPQHCDQCGKFLKNPLTNDGVAYVVSEIEDSNQDSVAVEEWLPYYRRMYPDNEDLEQFDEALDIETHSTGYGPPYLAINVKYRGSYDWSDKLTTQQSQTVWDQVAEMWWEDAKELAKQRGYANIYSEGRSGGWLLPCHNGKQYISPDAAMGDRIDFLKFKADIDLLLEGAEPMLTEMAQDYRGACNHTPAGYMAGSQSIRELTVHASVREIVRSVYAKLKPEARTAAHRPSRHAILMAAIDAMHHDRETYDFVQRGQ